VVNPAEASSGRSALLTAAVLLALALAAAVSVDVVKTGYGVKGDEATYVAMALSVAYDRDLTYERRDLERFTGLYKGGPEGIFLKTGKQLRIRPQARPPFMRLLKTPDTRNDRLYFGKAFVYSVAAAPFVRLLGLNGFLVFHVLLLFIVCACGYAFLAARSQPAPALLFTLAFVFATCVPVYAVFLTPEIFNFTLVFAAYFLWSYKKVAPETRSRLLGGFGSDLAAASLLGVVTYSKPTHALLIGPIVLWFWWRKRFVNGVVTGVVCVATAVALFAVNAAITGEFNYQGGDRRTCVSSPKAEPHFPLDAFGMEAWYGGHCLAMVTNDSDTSNVLTDFANRFTHNAEYFVVGRHFGFFPYFFPGVVAVLLWIASPERVRKWRILTFLAVAGSAVALLVFAPYTWSGGGGPPGNRYFMSMYAALFFVTPPLASSLPGIAAWIGGMLLTAKMLVNPFYAAKFPQIVAERGFARRLPVELTMANDLPIMLDATRAHIWFSDVMLYFLDEHAHTPETIDSQGQQGIWVAGDGRADILVRCEWPIDRLRITIESPIRTDFIASMGASEVSVPISPGKPTTIDVPASGVRGLNSYAYLLSVRSTGGFTPALVDRASTDLRNLGALMRFTAVPAGQ
jgi:hypothetical protein